jgi:hypothetical protein
MPLFSLLYVSRTRVGAAALESEAERILSVAIPRNASRGITGCLVSTERNFAQVLEGTPDALRELMASIEADERHDEVHTIEFNEVEKRLFPTWSMGYAGHSRYIQRFLEPLHGSSVSDRERARQVRRLVELMVELSSTESPSIAAEP